MTDAGARARWGPRAVVDAVSRAFSWISGALTLVLLLMLVAEVAVRELVGRSLLGTIELSEVLLVFIVALGTAHAQRTGAHVSTDLVTSRFPPVTGAAIRVTGMTIAAGFLLWTAWASAERGVASFRSGESRFGITEVPVWPARLVLPLGLALLAVQCLLMAKDAWHRRHAPTTDPVPAEDAGAAAGPVETPGPDGGPGPHEAPAPGRKAADVP